MSTTHPDIAAVREVVEAALALDNDAMVKKLGRVGLWAPGSYICICGGCGVQFIGDKRALRCLPCAVSAPQEPAGVGEEEWADANTVSSFPLGTLPRPSPLNREAVAHVIERAMSVGALLYDKDKPEEWRHRRDGFADAILALAQGEG